MRVLMVAQFFLPTVGGEERMVAAMGRELVARGHEVSVATLRVPDTPPRETIDGMRVHRVDALAQRAGAAFAEASRPHAVPVPDPIVSRGLARVMRQERPDVVHGHNWLVHSYLPLAPRARTPLAMSLHDFSLVCSVKRLVRRGARCAGPAPVKCLACSARHYGPKGVPIAAGLAAVQPVLRRTADVYLPVSQAVATRLRLDESGVPYEVLPNFLPSGESDAHAVEVPGLPDQDFALFVGDLTADKGIEVLLDAHAQLRVPMPLVLMGRPYSSRLRTPPPGVVVLGPRPHGQVLAAWRRCSVALAPSIWEEPFGLVALEAMAAGRPIVASRIGGIAEIVEDGVSGVLVKPADASELAAAIDRLVADRELRERLGRGAAIRAEAFTADALVPRLEDVYRQLLAGPS